MMQRWLTPALGILLAAAAFAQQPASLEQPDAQRVRQQFSALMGHYPPALRSVFGLDPTLLSNQPYLAPYPAIGAFLAQHPEIVKSPAYYVEEFAPHPEDHEYRRTGVDAVLNSLEPFLAFGMAIGLAVWLVRTITDYRRWNKLSKVQTDVHTRILDRFTGNEELLAYIQSPAGAKFLQSSPITLDAGPRTVAAPMGRILWSVQAGLVLAAAGTGLYLVSGQFRGRNAEPFVVFGALGIALGIGFVLSAILSFLISRKLGLIEARASE